MSDQHTEPAIDNALSVVVDGGAIDRTSVVRGAGVIVAIVVIGVAFAFSFVGGLHRPTFHHMPIGVVGPRPLAQALQHGGAFAVTDVQSRQAAVQRIDDRSAFGAVIVGATGVDLIVAQAAGASSTAELADQLPAKLQAAVHLPVRVTDAKALPPEDPNGVSSFFLALSIVITNYTAAVFFAMVFGAKPARRRIAWRLVGLGAIALVMATGEVGLVNAIGPLRGHFVLLVLVALLLGLTASVVTTSLQSTFGMVGTTIAVLVFIVFGNPSSGGPFPTQTLPGLWRWFGPYLPTGAGVDLIRNITYFGGHATTRPLIVLATWLTLAIGLAWLSLRLSPIGLQMKGDFDRLRARSANAVSGKTATQIP
jgi:hypothetical protein